jgi:hypothetical protein
MQSVVDKVAAVGQISVLILHFSLSIIISTVFHIHIYSSVIDAVWTRYGECH